MTITPWYSPAPFVRRDFVYGDSFVGKTQGLLSFASRMPGKVRIIDTDGAIEVLLFKSHKELAESGKVEVRVVTDWDEAVKAMAWAFNGMGKEDLVGIDSISDLRDFNMDWATEKVTGKDMGAFMTQWLTVSSVSEIKSTGQQGFLISNGVYDLANPTWRKDVMARIKVPKCNVFMTAHANESGNPREDALTKQLFAPYGFKPAGEKNVAFGAATVLLLGKSKVGKMSFTVVKDWGSQGGERDVVYDDLATAVLMKREGWRPGKNV